MKGCWKHVIEEKDIVDGHYIKIAFLKSGIIPFARHEVLGENCERKFNSVWVEVPHNVVFTESNIRFLGGAFKDIEVSMEEHCAVGKYDILNGIWHGMQFRIEADRTFSKLAEPYDWIAGCGNVVKVEFRMEKFDATAVRIADAGTYDVETYQRIRSLRGDDVMAVFGKKIAWGGVANDRVDGFATRMQGLRVDQFGNAW